MQKEMMSSRQVICTMVMFLFGSTVIMGVSTGTGQDSWISLLLAVVIVIPALLVYARIIQLAPEKDIFEIAELLFGKVIGKVITVLMTWYALHLGSLVLRNFAEFIQIDNMPETPQLPIMIFMILVVVYMVKSGVETMGKWSTIVLGVILLIVLLTILLSLEKMDFTNILPVFEHDFKMIAKGSLQIFTFPYAETVLFLTIACSMKKTDSPYKNYFIAMLIGTVILLSIVLRNLFLIGPALVKDAYFPSYTAVRIINAGEFISRIEGSIAINLILAGILKIAVCVIAATKGMASLFSMKNYRHILFPVSMCMVALCAIIYDNAMDMFAFINIYPIYAIPFQVIIPLSVWVAAEVKLRPARAARKKAEAGGE